MPFIKQRIPNFVSVEKEAVTTEYHTVKELFNFNFVKHYSQFDDFECFNLTEKYLFAVYKDNVQICIGMIAENKEDL